MGAPEERSDKLSELDRRIRAAREARVPKRGKQGDKFAMANVAWRMTLELVVGGCVGAGMGYGLDWVFGTLPLFLIVFTLLGFAGGVRTAMKSAQEVQRIQAANAAAGEQAARAAKDGDAAGRQGSNGATRRGNDGD